MIPIENLWRELKFKVRGRKPTNITELENFGSKERSKVIQLIISYCMNIFAQMHLFASCSLLMHLLSFIKNVFHYFPHLSLNKVTAAAQSWKALS